MAWKYSIALLASILRLSIVNGALAPTPPGCATMEIDMVFLVDASSGVTQATFEKNKEFVKSIVQAYDISPMTSRISVVTYGATSTILNSLDNITDSNAEAGESFGKEQLLQSIDRATKVRGMRRIGQAMNLACDEILGFKSSDFVRRGVPMIIVAISNGFSEDDISSDLSCRSMDGDVSVVGLTTDSRGASSLASKHVDILLRGERDLDLIKDDLFEAICVDAAYKNIIASQDLVFVIDRSQELSTESIEHVKQWISEVSGSFKIGANYTRTGIVEFGGTTSEIVNPINIENPEDFTEALEGIVYRESEAQPRNVEKALRFVAQNSFRDEESDQRQNLRRTVVLITTGSFDDVEAAKVAARDLHLGGVEIFILNIGGKAAKEEFFSFLSKPYSTHIFDITATSEMLRTYKLFVQYMIRGIFQRYSGALLDIHFVGGGISDENIQLRTKALMKRIADLFYIGTYYNRIMTLGWSDGEIIRSSAVTKDDALKALDQMPLGGEVEIQTLLDLDVLAETTDEESDSDSEYRREKVFIVLSPEVYGNTEYWKDIDALRSNGIHTYWYGLSSDGLSWRDGANSYGSIEGMASNYRPAANMFVDKISRDSVQGCGAFELDLQFLLDGSSSIKDDDFLQVQDWVQSLVSQFDVGKYTTRVGIDQYSSDPETEFHMNEYDEKESLLQAIDSMDQKKGLTKIGAAMNYSSSNSLIPEAGTRDGVQKIIMVLTDGRSRDRVDKAAAHLHSMKDVTTYSVGVADADFDQLHEIASEPKDVHMFQVDDFDQMSALKNRLGSSMCQTVKDIPAPANEGDELDLIVLFEDSTLSSSSKFYAYVEQFILNLARSALAQYDSRFAVVNFAAVPRTVMDFTVNITALIDALRTADQDGSYYSSVNLDLALAHVQGMFFETPGRENAQKVLVTIMSNPTKEESFQNAKYLADKGVHVFGISLGRTASLTTLEELVTRPDYFFGLDDATSLVTVEPTLKRKIREVSKTECKDSEMSIVFVVDDSSDITDTDFENTLQFFSSVTNGLSIDEENTHVSIVMSEPDSSSYRILNLMEGNVTATLLTLPVETTLVNASNAIRLTINNMFSDVVDDRRNVPKVIIAVTNGEGLGSTDDDFVYFEGAALFQVVVGGSESPSGDSTVQVESYDDLSTANAKMINMLCSTAKCPLLFPKVLKVRDTRRGSDVIEMMDLAGSPEMLVTVEDGMQDFSQSYRFQGRSRAMSSKNEIFPNGFPTRDFMLVTTIKMGKRASEGEAWQIIQLTAPGGDTEFSVSVDATRGEIGVFGASNPPEIATFRGDTVSSFFDRDWHKLQLVFTGDNVELYVDCKMAGSQPFASSRMASSRDGGVNLGKLIRSRKSSAFLIERLDVFCGLQGSVESNLEGCCEVKGIDLPECKSTEKEETTTTTTTTTEATTTTTTEATTTTTTTTPATTSTTVSNSDLGGGTGSSIEFPTCNCPEGPPGPPGPAGPSGPRGPNGDPGIPGNDGYDGVTGPKGMKGEPGLSGDEPVVGPAGPVGPRGPPGPPGPPGPRGLAGVPGSGGPIVSGVTNQKAYVWETNDARITQISQEECRNLMNTELPRMVAALVETELFRERYRGQKGDIGPQGEPGYAGEPGQTGVSGLRGREGLRGRPGPEGPIGQPGPKGSVGERGDPGFGIPGLDGRPGRRGPPGESIQGETGQKGAQGPSGARGQPGHGGRRGPHGINGRCEPDTCYAVALRAMSSSRDYGSEYNIKG